MIRGFDLMDHSNLLIFFVVVGFCCCCFCVHYHCQLEKLLKTLPSTQWCYKGRAVWVSGMSSQGSMLGYSQVIRRPKFSFA